MRTTPTSGTTGHLELDQRRLRHGGVRRGVGHALKSVDGGVDVVEQRDRLDAERRRGE